LDLASLSTSSRGGIDSRQQGRATRLDVSQQLRLGESYFFFLPVFFFAFFAFFAFLAICPSAIQSWFNASRPRHAQTHSTPQLQN
jgi:hypothetical protein